MEFKVLTENEIKKTIKENRIVFREFFIGRRVYGCKSKDGTIVAMCGVSQNKQLYGLRKIYSPFILNNDMDIGTALLQMVVAELMSENKEVIIFSDLVTELKPIFENAGFRITDKRSGLVRYDTLWRGVVC
jgi:hypothetical protein